jgi:phage terminase large subunit-like protein
VSLTLEEVKQIEHCTLPRGYRPDKLCSGYYFDADAAYRACGFAPKLLKHFKGHKGGEPLELELWQYNIIGTLFGWKRVGTNFRRYREAYIEVPRGNGKSTMCQVVAGVLLTVDKEPGAEIFGAAGTRDQAKEVFGQFKSNVLSNPTLKKRMKAYVNHVEYIDVETDIVKGVYKVISADADYQHGGSPHGVIFDELHVQPTRDLYDVLKTGMVKRRQPLLVSLTTAGYDRETICYEQRKYAEAVIAGSIDDPTFLPVIYAADIDNDFLLPETWRKANPNLGVSIQEEDLAREAKKAAGNPSYLNTFKRLHLNIWTEQSVLAIPMEEWDKCHPLEGSSPVERRQAMLEALEGCVCYGGLDMATTRDLAAFVLFFPEDNAVIPYFFAPEKAATKRAAEPGNSGRFFEWSSAGFLTLCPGDEIDQRVIFETIKQANNRFNIRDIGFDKWQSMKIAKELESEGMEMIKYTQSAANFNEPFKRVIDSVHLHSLNHGHNPILRWNAANTAAQTDASGYMRPDKKRSQDKIDGVVAMLMAIGRSIVSENDSWLDRGGSILM